MNLRYTSVGDGCYHARSMPRYRLPSKRNPYEDPADGNNSDIARSHSLLAMKCNARVPEVGETSSPVEQKSSPGGAQAAWSSLLRNTKTVWIRHCIDQRLMLMESEAMANQGAK